MAINNENRVIIHQDPTTCTEKQAITTKHMQREVKRFIIIIEYLVLSNVME